MKHYERHTFVIDFCPVTFDKNWKALSQELTLFKGSWPSAQTDFGIGYVSISYANKSNCYNMAQDAAEHFRQAVKRHSWWKEVNV